MIEFELACDSHVLSNRFASAAERLSQSFAASNITIERVQEQFLKAVWLKCESKIVESWHALSGTIRVAQELGKAHDYGLLLNHKWKYSELTYAGIDKDTGIEDLSEFDVEIRRRMWTVLYTWDCKRKSRHRTD
jgi:hypothetical protein